MSGNIFQEVKESLYPRLGAILLELLPGGRQTGREYVCGSLQGGPDNDEPGFKAALTLTELLDGKAAVAIVQPTDTLPEKWDLADPATPGFLPQVHIATALPMTEFRHRAGKRYPGLAPDIREGREGEDLEDMPLKAWPAFPYAACPGLVGEFVALATRDSEADPAAVCVTMLIRFAAEVYGYAENKGPHIYIGETLHAPRLFAVICGNSSKARKGTSLSPVNKLFTREHCLASEMKALNLPIQAQQYGLVTISAAAKGQWADIYPELSREHSGLAGSIINRAEAQTLRLALIYALLDGQNVIQPKHLDAALVFWRYAQESALYIFGDRAADPLEEKILEALKQGPLTATELSAVFCRHVPKERLQPLLQQMDAQQRISITKQKNVGRPKLMISLRSICDKSAISEKRENSEFSEIKESPC